MNQPTGASAGDGTPDASILTTLALLYAPPKKLKTSAALAVFPRAVVIGVAANVVPIAENSLGFCPIIYGRDVAPGCAVRDLDGLKNAAEWLYKEGILQYLGAMIIDDVSLLCKAQLVKWKETVKRPEHLTRSGRVDGRLPYQWLATWWDRFAEWLCHLGVNVVVTGHELGPRTNSDTGAWEEGGANLGSQARIRAVTAWFHINLRGVADKHYIDPWLDVSWFCNPFDTNYVTGDRNEVAGKATPPNLRELLRASQSNYHTPRISGLEWQDEVAEQVAAVVVDGLTAGQPQAAVREALTPMFRQVGYAEVPNKPTDLKGLHMRWACQDGIARAVLRHQLEAPLFLGDAAQPDTCPNPFAPKSQSQAPTNGAGAGTSTARLPGT